MSCSRAHVGRFINARLSGPWPGGRTWDERSRAGEQVSTGDGTVAGFPQKPRPRGKPVDRLPWGRWSASDREESRWRSREHAIERCLDDPATGEARTCRSPARKGAHDRGRLTAEPCEVETLMHGSAAEAGGAIPSSTVTGRGPAALCGSVVGCRSVAILPRR